MLDRDTKRKIKSVREILVGKIPDPTVQVDQISTALIYKFMDDMDKEAIANGGRACFFTGGFKKFRWAKLMDRRLSGAKRLDLYTQALSQFPKNKKLPPLFREIFKNAFLPYRDAETLSLFLKEINGFSYDHSENLGNAFEYLLSILGSQGDAGQFRTPRHIIDFIVEVLDPKKEESVLDPACGTGGFLISAYKHIIKNNSKNYDPKKDKLGFGANAPSLPSLSSLKEQQESQGLSVASAFDVRIQSNGKYKGENLKPFQKRKLQNNIIGYDISPKMVKLSLVNMYLHNFKNPKIYEYDTLTGENHWGDDFDVILANPPFMSPKGGIRPHNKFSLQASRSEVLFVDYIAGHLSINGRAGIIVPEGIIFKSDKAYKALRKILLEERLLWAVVSLPAKIFEPYSGVKTSILFLDKKRAKHTDEILFVDVQNDGFDLGATRRRTDKNNLPEAFQVLKAWGGGIKFYEKHKSKKHNRKKHKGRGHSGEKHDDKKHGPLAPLAHWTHRDKITKSGDYNLTGNRYKEESAQRPGKQPMVQLGKLCDIFNGSRPKGGAVNNGILSIGGEHINPDGSFNLKKAKYIPETFFNKMKRGRLQSGDVLIVKDGATTGKTGYFDKNAPFKTGAVNEHVFILRPHIDTIDPFYLYQIMKSEKGNMEILKFKTGAAQGGINLSIKAIKIPLPSLEAQKEIVLEIESWEKIIDGAKQVVENWKPAIKTDLSWPMVELGKICQFNPKKSEVKNLPKNHIVSFVPMSDLNSYNINFTIKQERCLKDVFNGYTYFSTGDILLARVTPCFENGKSGLAKNLKNGIGFGSSEYFIYRPDIKKVLPEMLYYFISSPEFIKKGKKNMSGTGGLQRLTKDYAIKYKVPLPPLKEQKEIVSRIKEEQAHIEACKKLIKSHKIKIQQKINEVWK